MAPKGLTPLRKGGAVHKHVGKGATEEKLPSRHALATLTKGDQFSRTINDYAKATPGIGDATPLEDFG